jgi:hypothetical protein
MPLCVLLFLFLIIPTCTSSVDISLNISECTSFNATTQNTLIQLNGDVFADGVVCFSFHGVNNIILDGNGYTLNSRELATGILVQSSSNVIVQNVRIIGSNLAINFISCSNCSIFNNVISDLVYTPLPSAVISVDQSDVVIFNNTFTDFSITGKVLSVSNSTVHIVSNLMFNIKAVFDTTFIEVSSSTATIWENSLVALSLSCSYSGASFSSAFYGFAFNNCNAVCEGNSMKGISSDSEFCEKSFIGFMGRASGTNLQLTNNEIQSIEVLSELGFSSMVKGLYLEDLTKNSVANLMDNRIVGIISNNAYGIFVNSHDSVTIIHNNISLSALSDSYGVLVSNSSNLVLYGNYVENSGRAYQLPTDVDNSCNPGYHNAPNSCFSYINDLECCKSCKFIDPCYGNFSTHSYSIGSCLDLKVCTFTSNYIVSTGEINITTYTTLTSVTVKWNRPANVPDDIAITYVVVISKNTMQLYNFTLSDHLDPFLLHKVHNLDPNVTFQVDVIPSIGSPASQLFTTVASPFPSFAYTNVSFTSVHFEIGDTTVYDSVMIEYSTFADFLGERLYYPVNLTIENLTINTTYYFRVVFTEGAITTYSEVVNITTLSYSVFPPNVEWIAPQTMVVNWSAAPFPTNYTLTILPNDEDSPRIFIGARTTLEITNLSANTTYHLWLSVQSSNSPQVTVATPPMASLLYLESTS